MASWLLKAVVQKGISFLPFKHRLNYVFQKYITKGVILTDALFESKLLHCKQHLAVLQAHSNYQKDFIVLELGTGWYPVVPIGLFLAGSKTIYTADIKSTVSNKQCEDVIRKYLTYFDSGKLENFLPTVKEERIEILRNCLQKNISRDALYTACNIIFLEGDITKMNLPETKMHIINSNNTFEHIPAPVLENILRFFHTIIVEDGVMSHFIDMSDHFSHSDTSVSNYNFLKFTKRQWKIIDNSIQPQNRLRINKYRKMLVDTGWEILNEEKTVAQPGRIAEIQVSKEFSDTSVEDLSVTHVLFACKPS